MSAIKPHIDIKIFTAISFTYRAKDGEETRWEIAPQSTGTCGEDSQREGQRPPAHIERELFGYEQGSNCKGKPHQSEGPHENADH